MANTVIAYDEVRFDVRNKEITECYVFINNMSNDGLIGVHGWHFKAFPASMSIMDIMKEWAAGDDPLMWPQKSPKSE
ncbi:hypothetical protein [Agitococcus lubricus]|nr:hypothetical protein [Agitococcus lubricus]